MARKQQETKTKDPANVARGKALAAMMAERRRQEQEQGTRGGQAGTTISGGKGAKVGPISGGSTTGSTSRKGGTAAGTSGTARSGAVAPLSIPTATFDATWQQNVIEAKSYLDQAATLMGHALETISEGKIDLGNQYYLGALNFVEQGRSRLTTMRSGGRS